MTPLRICQINFRPGWRHENPFVIPLSFAKQRLDRLSRQMLNSGRSVHQTPVKENPSFLRSCGNLVGYGHRKGAMQKGPLVHPRKGRASAIDLFTNDPPPGLFDNGVPASSKLSKQGRLSPSRAPGDHNEAAHINLELLPPH